MKWTTVRIPVLIHRKVRQRADESDSRVDHTVADLLTAALSNLSTETESGSQSIEGASR